MEHTSSATGRARRIAEAQRVIDVTRQARDVANVEETRLALSWECAPAESRPAILVEWDRARAVCVLLGGTHERAQRTLTAILAESPAEELEIGDPLAGMVTRTTLDGRIECVREWSA